MTTNQMIDGVPRTTLANFIEYSVPVSGNDEAWQREKAEQLGLLDAPAKCEMCDGSGRLGMGLCECFDTQAAQPKGAPLHGMFHRVTENDKVIYEPQIILPDVDFKGSIDAAKDLVK